MINGISWLVVTKLDVLDHLTEIPVCVGYKVDGKETDEVPAQASGYDKIECIYRKMPGWASPTQAIRKLGSIAQGRAQLPGVYRKGDWSAGGNDFHRARS